MPQPRYIPGAARGHRRLDTAETVRRQELLMLQRENSHRSEKMSTSTRSIQQQLFAGLKTTARFAHVLEVVFRFPEERISPVSKFEYFSGSVFKEADITESQADALVEHVKDVLDDAVNAFMKRNDEHTWYSITAAVPKFDINRPRMRYTPSGAPSIVAPSVVVETA
ncbi:hypothetical protein TWF703_000080 [Orbilia oligospora]|uniref:Uncharacterized protein n=1 Tax=Orbilia oligospora TaxID=2813651 RepID=A0A7C8PDY5_ORBOL|nr:hypothetical protein TWF703_000080 [Orbilia oligospora]